MNEKVYHPWIVRAGICVAMILLSFVGLIITDVMRDGTWNYWRVMVPLFAFLSIFLSYYLRKAGSSHSKVKLYQEVLHWVGLMLAVYLVSLYVRMGIMGRFEAGLIVLTLLSLTVFTAGVYIESSFLVLGTLLGLFALVAALFEEYLYSIVLPVVVVGSVVVAYLSYKKKAKSAPPQKSEADSSNSTTQSRDP